MVNTSSSCAKLHGLTYVAADLNIELSFFFIFFDVKLTFFGCRDSINAFVWISKIIGSDVTKFNPLPFECSFIGSQKIARDEFVDFDIETFDQWVLDGVHGRGGKDKGGRSCHSERFSEES